MAIYWYEKAAKFGNPEAQFWLGRHYDTVDEEKVFYFFKKAAEGGHAHGQYLLGWCHQNGIGTKADNQQATFWYKKSGYDYYI